MNEAPPRFRSKRFREILWSAVRGKPVAALVALYWFVTRRRVRGWGGLLIAASEAPYDYRRWIANGEPRAFAAYRRAHQARGALALVTLLVMDDIPDEMSVERTVASVRAALGKDAPIYWGSAKSPRADIRPLANAGNLKSVLAFLAKEHGGAWLFPVLSGDEVSPATYDILRRALADKADSVIGYWDEDKLAACGRADPWIKPDWDDLLFGQLGGLAGASIVSLTVAQGALDLIADRPLDRRGLEHLFMSVGAARSFPSPLHVPLVLTHRTEKHALKRAAEFRRDVGTLVSHERILKWPSVSILVPTRDRPDLLNACLRGVEATNYPGELEIVVIDNGSADPDALRILASLTNNSRAKVLRDEGDFNFARLNNSAATIANGEFLCFLNNDVEPLDENWLRIMVSHAIDRNVGAVGAQLLYPSGRIQHAGVAIGIGGAAGHVQKGVDPQSHRFWTWHAVPRIVSAVTAAAMVLRARNFHAVGGFDEAAFPVAFNDVDLCLRLEKAGFRNIYAADARLLHHESESRGDDRSKVNAARFAGELERLQQRWRTEEIADCRFSPLFSHVVEQCVLTP